MILEDQLRALAEAAAVEQRPVTAPEAMERADELDVVQFAAPHHRWLVAASIVLLAGGLVVLLAWDRAPDDPIPVVSLPETNPPTTIPTTTIPTTTIPTTALPATTVPTGDSSDASVPLASDGSEALVNEPTLDYRDGFDWWVPGDLPDGWRYGYAAHDGEVQTVRLLADDRTTIDIQSGADGATIDDLAADAVTEELGGVPWQVVQDDDGIGGAMRVIDGRLLAVLGPVEPARAVAAGLELVPERALVRPPFRADAEPGPVVLTIPAAESGGEEPFELRAHTDGLFTTVGGDIKRVSAEDPLAFGDYAYARTGEADSYRVVVTGVALDGVGPISFGLQAGDTAEVTPSDSARFAEDFYAFVIDVPASVLDEYERGGLQRLTRWTFTFVDGEQRVYDEPGSQNCVNCGARPVGPSEPGSTTPDDGYLEPIGTADPPPLEFEPTNVYGDDMWWVPSVVPDGYEFAYALLDPADEGDGHHLVYLPADGPGSRRGMLEVAHHPGTGHVDPPPDAPAPSDEVVGGVAWMWTGDASYGSFSRRTNGGTLTVSGERDVALVVARDLDRVPEAQLERPPFRSDSSKSLLVTELSGVATSADIARELRVSTDGVAVQVDGRVPQQVRLDDWVTFDRATSPSSEPGADTGVIIVSGMTRPGVATLEFEQLDGQVITVVPEDRSGRFGIGFFLAAIDTPLDGLGNDGTYASLVPSVTARAADGEILAVISEPF
jgi:hypothetical protein